MARLLIYDTTSRQIFIALDSTTSAGTWTNSGTYAADKAVVIDGITKIYGLSSGMSALNFSGTIPGTFDDSYGSNPTEGNIWELNVGLDTIQLIT